VFSGSRPNPFLVAVALIATIGAVAVLLSSPDADGEPRPALPFGLDEDPAMQDLSGVLEREAEAAALAPDLLMALAWRESMWDQSVVSEVGAVGVLQLMPSTATFVAEEVVGEPELDPLVTDDNVRLGASYLAWLTGRQDGDVEAALADYVQGPTSIAENGRFQVTQDYVTDVLVLQPEFATAP
jgi:soluble lytic murein transglycosylase-like protein